MQKLNGLNLVCMYSVLYTYSTFLELNPSLLPHEALMVGDDVRDDVLGAQQVHNNIIQYLCGMINDFMDFIYSWSLAFIGSSHT